VRSLVLGTAGTLWLAVAATGDELERVSWLVGTWRAEVEGVVLEEHWIPGYGRLMLGLSRTVADGKAVGFEFLRIEAPGTDLVYIAQPNGRPGTEFTLTEWSTIDLRFTNFGHDHPKLIHYRLQEDGSLGVQIEGDEGPQAWTFQRIESP